MQTAHSISTLLACQWKLVGKPAGVQKWMTERGEIETHRFVQRSHISGRPWLRFSLSLDRPNDWYVSAYKTKSEALSYITRQG